MRSDSPPDASRYVVTDIGATLGRVGGLGVKRVRTRLMTLRPPFHCGSQYGIVIDYSTLLGCRKFASLFIPGYGKSQANKEKASVTFRRQRPVVAEGVAAFEDQLNDIFREQL